MRWRGRRQSDNVVDRRGAGRASYPRGARVRVPRGGGPEGARRAGAGTLILFAVVALLLWAFAGINPIHLVSILAGEGDPVLAERPARAPVPIGEAEDERAAFLAVVLAETETTWERIFRRNGGTYDPPTLVLYSGFARSACGVETAAAGPFYCPADETIYVDTSFFDLLARRLDAPGDFAQAYVLAHEVGHHVQHETGALADLRAARADGADGRRAALLGIAIELQADCYAGVWAHYANRIGILEEGDVEEAMTAAAAVGDDMIQLREQGYVVPETFSHGTAQQRSGWFLTGYRTGDPDACDTRRTAG